MLYAEFIEGTGCKQNYHNYQVYKRLEVMYMYTDMSKHEIYEYGKKLVDNSKSPEELQLEKEILGQIEEAKERLAKHKADVKRYQQMYEEDKTDKFWKDQMEFSKKMVKLEKKHVEALKWVLAK